MTDCAAPRHDNGAPETEPQAYLCRGCRHALRRDLARLPGLRADLRQMITTHQPGQRGDGNGLPFSEPISECTDQITHDLTWWMLTAHRERRRHEPLPALEVGTMGAYLQRLASPPRPWIPYRPWAPEMAGAIADDRQRATSLLDPWIRKRFPIRGPDGQCLDCGTGQLYVTVYASDGDRRRSYAACATCGQRWEPEQWLRLGKRIHQRREQAIA